MMNMYGARNIIPNNYYFTFDKIYESEEEAFNNAANDGILIGRTVLARKDATVLLKTVKGYLRVAKLDNSGRLNMLENYVLSSKDNIDKLDGKGFTFNGDGTYIVNKNQVLVRENGNGNNPTVSETVDVQGTFPTISGVGNYARKGAKRVFLLEQFSNAPTYQNNGKYTVEVFQRLTEIGYTEYTEETTSMIDEDGTVSTNINYTGAIPESCIADDQALFLNNRDQIKHTNKTFCRKGTFIYTPYTPTTDSTEPIYDLIQKSDPDIRTSKHTPSTNSFMLRTNGNTNISGYSLEEPAWTEWNDITEQYTGYIGNLNSSKFDNLAEATNLTEAINADDEVIGSKTRLQKSDKKVNSHYGRGDNLQTNGDDYRSYNISEGNIIDALVHHDADIGKIEDVNTDNSYNLNFIKNKTDNGGNYISPLDTNLDSDKVDYSNITSLTGGIKKLDNVLGSQNRLGPKSSAVYVSTPGQSNGKANTVTGLGEIYDDSGSFISYTDERVYDIPETNIIDALVRLAADIGKLDTVNDPNYTIVKNQNNSTDDSAVGTKPNLISLEDIIHHLSAYVIGDSKAGYTDSSTGVNNGLKNTQTIIQNLNALSDAIGGTQNQISPIQNGVDNGRSIVTDINALNTAIGDRNNDINPEQNGVANGQSIVADINALNSLIGIINNLTDGAEENISGANLILKLNSLFKNDIGSRKKLETANNDYNNKLASSQTLSENIDNISKKIGKTEDLTNGIGSGDDVSDSNTIKKNLGILDKRTKDLDADSLKGLYEYFDDDPTHAKELGTQDTNGNVAETTLIGKLNYLIKEIIGFTNEPYEKDNGDIIWVKRKSLQDQIIDLSTHINQLAENLNITDATVQAKIGGGSGSLQWHSL